MATKKTVKTTAPANVKKAAPAAKAAAVKKPSGTKAVDIEAIRKKAEEIYHARVARGEHGTPEGDWHYAEHLLKGGTKVTAKKPEVKKAVAKKPVAKKK